MLGTIAAVFAIGFALERMQLRNRNGLLLDFVLTRSLGNNGAGFARSVFETRPSFEASV